MKSVVSWTVFPNVSESRGTRREGEREAFFQHLSKPRKVARTALTPKTTGTGYEKPDDLELFAPGTFTGDQRARENVETLFAVGLDLEDVPLATIKEKLAPYWYVLKSSLNENCYHAFVFTDRPVAADQYAACHSYLRILLGSASAEKAKDPSRQWYAPIVIEGEKYVCFAAGESPLKVGEILALDRPELAPVKAAPGASPSSADMDEEAAGLLGRNWPKNGRHQAQLALAGGLAKEARWSDDRTLEMLCRVCAIAGNEERPKREATVDDTYARLERRERVTGFAELKKHVPVHVVNAFKHLLKIDGDAKELFAKKVEPSPVTAPEAPRPKSELFKFKTGGWTEPVPPMDYVVDGVIQKASVNMFVARGSSLKTWAALSVALAIASGQRWLGVHDVKPEPGGPFKRSRTGNAAIVSFEDGTDEVQRRLQILGVKDDVAERLHVCSYPAARLQEEKAWEELADSLKGFDLLVVDSLAACQPGENENDTRAAVPLQLAAQFANGTGCAVIFIHHKGKGEKSDARDGIRGTSAFYAALDWAYEFGDVEDLGNDVKRATMFVLKPGAGRAPKPITMELSDAHGLRLVSDHQTSNPGDVTAEAEKAFADKGSFDNIKALARAIGKREEVAKEVADALISQRKVLKKDRRAPMFWCGPEHVKKRVLAVIQTKDPCVTFKQLAVMSNVYDEHVQGLEADRVIEKASFGYRASRWRVPVA